MHKCPRCGQEFEGNFCPNCGYSYVNNQAYEQFQQPQPSKFKQKLSAVGSWFKKAWAWVKSHLKIVIPVTAAVIALIILISVLATVLPNKFRVGKVSKVELGYTQQQVLKVLGEPYEGTKTDYKWEYYDDKVMDVIDKINKNLAETEKALLNGDERKLEMLLVNELKLESMTYKYIEVNFTYDNEVYKVSSVYFDTKHSANSSETEIKKEVKKVEIPGFTDVEKFNYYIDDTIYEGCIVQYGGSLERLSYNAKFKDGSYCKGYINNPPEILENGFWSYGIALKWADNFSEYNVQNSAYEFGKIDANNIWHPYDICYGLTELILPDNVKGVIGGFYGFESITVSENNLYLSSINGVLYNKDITELLFVPGSVKNFSIPDSVTSIGDEAFRGCSSLTSITIPDSVTSIGDEAFRGCSSLASVIIPDSVTEIGRDAFCYCSGLTSITIPDSVTSIGDEAFRGCSSLETVYWNAIDCTVNGSSYAVFKDCGKLTKIVLGDNVTTIPAYAFSNCSGLTSITIPDRASVHYLHPTSNSSVF